MCDLGPALYDTMFLHLAGLTMLYLMHRTVRRAKRLVADPSFYRHMWITLFISPGLGMVSWHERRSFATPVQDADIDVLLACRRQAVGLWLLAGVLIMSAGSVIHKVNDAVC